MNRWMLDRIFIIAGLLALGACARLEPKPPAPSGGHIQAPEEAAAAAAGIPALAGQEPLLPPPASGGELEKYTVVVKEMEVREVLFALTRDAGLNVDIDSAVSGVATINAIEQTLPQLLERIARQVPLRYEFQGRNLAILPDTPFFRSYSIDYIDMSRRASSSIESASQIESAVGGGVDAVGGGRGGRGSSGSSVAIKISTPVNAAMEGWKFFAPNVTFATFGAD